MVLNLLAEHINKPDRKQTSTGLLSIKEKFQLAAVLLYGHAAEAAENLHKKVFGKKDKSQHDHTS